MSSTYVIDDAQRERHLSAADFPLIVGGPEADIPLVGRNGSGPVAFLGLVDGRLFVQPAEPGQSIACNGQALTASTWLTDGDVLTAGSARIAVVSDGQATRFVLEEAASDDAPPILVEPSFPASSHGSAPPSSRHEEIGRPIEFRPRPIDDRQRWRPRPAVVLLTLVLLGLAACAAFVFSARSVLIETEPPADRLTLSGGLLRPLVADRFLLIPGRYTVTAEKEGFRPLTEILEVAGDASQTFRLDFQTLPAQLAIDTGEIAGAEVFVNEVSVGSTPLAPVELEPGAHEVRIVADRYLPFSAPVQLAEGGDVQTLEVALVPAWATVQLTSEPAGATVRANGERLGTTPIATELAAGDYTVELTLARHKPHRRRLTVVADEPQTVPPIRLEPSDGNLIIASEPPGATVTIAGIYRGETPLDLFLPPGKAHRLDVAKAGFEAAAREVTVRSGESQEERFTLAPRLGKVEILGWPPDAELYINGESRGSASQTLRLAAVPQDIELRKEGYETAGTRVTPLPGLRQSVELRLKTREQAKAEAILPVIRTSEGHELRLIEPGRFRMGASRREPGRRANETLREVQLSRAFYLGTQEISNGQFRRFKSDHLSGQAGGHNLERDDHPAVRVTWEEAAAYCNWLSKKESLPPFYVLTDGKLVAKQPYNSGYRLPTEAEWAWAARYAGGQGSRKYPWGDALPIAARSGNYADTAASGIVPGVLADYSDSFPVTAPVDSFAPDRLELHNLGGNVAEWVHDIYALYPSSSASQLVLDPMGGDEGPHHVIRGSSWMHGSVTQLRLSYRDYGDEPRPDLGFRIARTLE